MAIHALVKTPVVIGSSVALVFGMTAAIGVSSVAAATPPTPRVAAPIVKGVVAGGSGMTLVALQPSGRARKVKLGGSGSFSLPLSTTPAGTTLHLISSNGRYFGPLVLRGNAARGAALKASLTYSQLAGTAPKARPRVQRVLNLGRFTKRSNSFATANTPTSPLYVRANKAAFGAPSAQGRPIGAGKLGRVSVPNAAILRDASKPGNDKDRDGIPGAFDIDDDGDLILDNVDRSPRAGTVRAFNAQNVGTDGLRLFSNYKSTQPDFSDIINANVAIPTTDQLDESVRTKTSFAIQTIPGGVLTCTGQVYCPASLDISTPGLTGDVQWQPGVEFPALTASQINPGDAFVATAGGATYPGVLNFIFKTTPALKSYSIIDSDGNLGTPVEVDWSGVGAKAGSTGSPINVDADAGEKVRLTFWRPQRAAVGDEANLGGYVDIGGLTYKADSHPGFCAATAVEGDGTVTVADGGSTVVRDDNADALPSNSRTISMDVDPANCPQNTSVEDIDIQAVSLFGDNSAQKIFLNRV